MVNLNNKPAEASKLRSMMSAMKHRGLDDQSLTKSKEILQTPNIKTLWQQRRQLMLTEKINATEFLIGFIENYNK